MLSKLTQPCSQNQLLPAQPFSNAHSLHKLQSRSQYLSMSLSETQHPGSFQVHSQTISKAGPQKMKLQGKTKRKGRGPGNLPEEWDSGLKLHVTLNERGQLVGEREQYNKFVTALAALAQNGSYLPLDYERWSYMSKDNLDKLWEDVQENTTLPLEAKGMVFQTVNGMWKDWKARVKSIYFTPYENDPHHDFSHVPEGLEDDQVDGEKLSNLFKYWQSKKVKEAFQRNKASRAKKKYHHRTGKLSFPPLKAKMEQEGKNTTKLDVLIVAKELQGINEELGKVDESERTEEFEDILFTKSLGKDPQSHIRCTGRMIARNKSSLTSVSRESSLVFEQIEELRQLKEALEQESIKNDQTKLELLNLCKNDLDKVKEMVLDKMENMSSLTRRPNYDEDIVAGTGKVARPLPKSLTTHWVTIGKEMESDIFYYNSIKVGCKVVLLCTELPKEVVAEGVIVGVDLKEEIDKIALGPVFFKVLIEMEKKPSYLLERPRKGISTVREAVGQIVAWEIGNVIENKMRIGPIFRCCCNRKIVYDVWVFC